LPLRAIPQLSSLSHCSIGLQAAVLALQASLQRTQELEAERETLITELRQLSQLLREQRGFTLKLLQRAQLPAALHSVKRLRMHERPATLEDATVLDRAEYTGTPIELIIRIGSVIGSDVISVADFVEIA
jgi:hypothetical protein